MNWCPSVVPLDADDGSPYDAEMRCEKLLVLLVGGELLDGDVVVCHGAISDLILVICHN